MNPTPGDVHVNTPLTNISIAFMQDARNFVASRMFPNIPVQFQSDRYYTYDRGDFNRDEMEERAPATESAGGGYRLDNTPTYYCRQYSYHKDIPDQLRANADAVLNPDRDATAFVTMKALIRRERVFMSNYFGTGIWTGDQTGVGAAPGANQFLQWNDTASTPIEDIRTQKTVMLERTGFLPNKLLLGRKVYDKLLDHPDIVDRVKYGQTPGAPAQANLDILAKLFEVDEVVVSNAIYNTAKEGQTASHTFIAGKGALLVHAAQAPGLLVPSAGYTFSWTGLMGNGVEGNRVRQFRMENLQSDRVEIDIAFDMKKVSADLGVYFATAIA